MSANFFMRMRNFVLNFFGQIHHHQILVVIRNSSWLLLERIFRLIFSLIVGVLVARYLGPSEYGRLAYVIAFVAIFQALSSLGMDGIVVREIGKTPNSASIILGSAFALRISSGIIFWLLCVSVQLIIYGFHSQNFVLVLIIGFSMVFQASDCIDYWFQSQSQSKYVALVKMVVTLLSNSTKILFLLYGAPIEFFAALVALESILCALGLFLFYRRYPAQSYFKVNFKQCKFLLFEGWPFMAAGFVNIMQARVEFLIIEKMLGPSLLGHYAAALSLIEMFDVFGVIFTISVFPLLINSSKINFDNLMSRMYLIAFMIFCSMLPFIFLLWLFIDHIFGSEYIGVKEIFLLMSIRPLLSIIGMVRGMALKLEGRNLYALVCSGAGIVVALSLSLLLIPYFGITGAVISSVLSYFISNFVLDYFLYKRNFFNVLQIHRRL
jgi:O-antigen/teichoic acid export membrane protein